MMNRKMKNWTRMQSKAGKNSIWSYMPRYVIDTLGLESGDYVLYLPNGIGGFVMHKVSVEYICREYNVDVNSFARK